MKKVDILIAVGLWGGMENAINRTGRYLIEQGMDIRVVQCVWQGRDWIDPVIPFFCLNVENCGVTVDGLADAYTTFLEKQGKPDGVLATGLPFMCGVAYAARQYLGADFPIIAWPHSMIENYENGGMGQLSDFEDADYAFAINNAIKEDLEYVLLPERVFRVRNSYDEKMLVFNDDRDRKKFCYAGRIEKEKNVFGTLCALVETGDTDWMFHIVGEGPDRDRISTYVKEHHLEERVFLYGWSEKPWELLKECKTFIFSSTGSEAAPLVIPEALACGMTVLSTPAGNAREVIKDGENGFLYDSEEQLTSILKELMEGYRSYPKADICRRSVDIFSPKEALQQFFDCLDPIVPGSAPEEDEKKEKERQEAIREAVELINEKYFELEEDVHDLLNVYMLGKPMDVFPFTPIQADFDGKIPVWICWWQGFDNAPQLVKMCRNNTYQKFSEDDYRIVEITFDNMEKYISFPDWIWEKHKKGIISLTQLSDILRMGLLYYYGGLWMDATYYVAEPIPADKLLDRNLYALHLKNFNAIHVSQGKWTMNFLYTKKGHLLPQFIMNAFYYYYAAFDELSDYFMIDYFARMAYNRFSVIKDEIDALPPEQPDTFVLQDILNEPYPNVGYERIMKNTSIYKLSYYQKKPEPISENGNLTVYGHLLEMSSQNDNER